MTTLHLHIMNRPQPLMNSLSLGRFVKCNAASEKLSAYAVKAPV